MPSKIKLCNTERLLNNMREAFGHVLENSMYYYSGLYSTYNYPGKKENMDIPFFATMCYLQQGDYDSAVEIASIIRNFLKQNNITIGDELNISLKYVEGISILRNHKEVIKYLSNLFSEKLCDLMDIRYSISDELMKKIYPKITPYSEFCREFIHYERLVNDYKKEQKRNGVSYKKLITSLSTVLGHA